MRLEIWVHPCDDPNDYCRRDRDGANERDWNPEAEQVEEEVNIGA